MVIGGGGICVVHALVAVCLALCQSAYPPAVRTALQDPAGEVRGPAHHRRGRPRTHRRAVGQGPGGPPNRNGGLASPGAVGQGPGGPPNRNGGLASPGAVGQGPGGPPNRNGGLASPGAGLVTGCYTFYVFVNRLFSGFSFFHKTLKIP